MTNIIDTRIRLPMEFRPTVEGVDTSVYESQYDAVLNLADNQQKSFEQLKKDMDEANISHGIIHAEYEYGEQADILNKEVAKIVKKDPERFSGFEIGRAHV